MIFKHFYLALFSILSINHCGTKTTKQTNTATTISTYTSADLTKDPEISAALIASQMDSMTTSISSGETGGTGSTLMSLVDGAETRVCKANSDNTATVVITYSGSDARSMGKSTVTATRSGTENRVWSKTDGTAVTCSENQRAKINWTSSISGLNLAITTNRINNISKTFTNLLGISSNISRRNEVIGSKVIVWKDLSSKSIMNSSTSKLSVTDTTGAIKVLDSINEVKADNPMMIEITRNPSTGKPTVQTIVSGVNYAKNPGAFYVTSEFKNLTYDSTSSDPCTPSSGTLIMRIYSDDLFSTLAQTNILTYTSGVVSVTTDGIINTNFNTYVGNHTNHNCDLAQGN